MAIIENRSTEIGDVIRIRTEVPIIGVISLNMFADSTVGESMGMTGATIIPSFDPFGGRPDNSLNNIVQVNNLRYTVTTGASGSGVRKGIGVLDVDTEMWDINYPDANTAGAISQLYVSGTTLYAHATIYIGTIPSVRLTTLSLNLSTRTWTVLDERNMTFEAGVGRVINNSLYFFTAAVAEGAGPNPTVNNALMRYNIGANTFVEVSQFPLPQLDDDDRRINQIGRTTVDPTNEIIYVAYTPLRDTNARNAPRLYVYNIGTDTWSLTAANTEPINTNTIYYNTDDQLIYMQQFDGSKIITYNPSTNTWNNGLAEAPGRFTNIGGYNNLIYVLNRMRETIVYNPATDSWSAEAGQSRFFEKQFRFSVDGGLTFSEFMPLTDFNVQGIQIDQKNAFVVDLAYQRAGTDPSGELQWDDTTLSGFFDALPTPIYDRTIFKSLFEAFDPNVLGWAMNVLEKLYQRGLLADYIERNTPTKDDEDFVAFWFSMTHLFAILVYWMRNFEDISSNRLLLTEFLSNFDITLPFDLNLADEATIYTQRTDEYRRRGTLRILDPATNPNERVNGELLRLVDWMVNDFFLFGLTEASRFGWCIGLSSPMWTSTQGITNLIMGYEFTTSVEDLTAYPLVNAGSISIVEDTAINANVMRIAGYAGAGGTHGIDTGATPTNNNFLLAVNTSVDYEISFKVKKLSSDTLELNFEAYAYNTSLARLNLAPIDGSATNVNNFQSTPGAETVLIDDVYYTYTGILYSTTTADNTNFTGRINGYRGLKMPAATAYIGVKITVEGDANRSDFYLYDIKIRPKDLPISQGLFGLKNIIVSYIDNRGELNDENTRIFIQNKLIPYNSFLIPRWLDNA